jgi:hypothetical protein
MIRSEAMLIDKLFERRDLRVKSLPLSVCAAPGSAPFTSLKVTRLMPTLPAFPVPIRALHWVS